MRKIAAIALALATSACATVDSPAIKKSIADAKPPSSEMKSSIVQAARDFLFDPYSVRDAEISNVGQAPNGSWVCVKANAKNRLGGYTGRETIAVAFKDGKIIGHSMNDPLCSAPGIIWAKFRELENLKNI